MMLLPFIVVKKISTFKSCLLKIKPLSPISNNH